MRIAVDGRLINESGIGRYIRNLLENLAAIDSKNEYFILLKPKDVNKYNFGKNFKNVEANFNWYSVTEQVKLPALISQLNIDLAHFPHFNVPVFYKQSLPFAGAKDKRKFVVTIHDLIHQHFKMKRATTLDPLTYKVKQFGYNKVFNFAVNDSEKILVPSEFVKLQLEKEWKIKSQKICVTPEGVDDSLLSIINKRNKNIQKKLLEKIGVTQPYIFYVGNAHPHKNVESLIKAFKGLKSDFPDLKLVLAGADHYFWRRIKMEYKGEDIIYTGFVTDEVLAILFANAEAFVMPSLEEGFGIPVLESFACGCPVICSDIGSLKEVGGDACIYFDPKDSDDMTTKIKKVLKDEKLRKNMIGKGEKRVKDFSWRKLAEETLKVYQT